MKIKLNCQNCNNVFETEYKFRDKKYCNQNCYFEHAKKIKLLGNKYDKSVRETRKCLQCGSEFTERKKHERKLCSDDCRLLWNKKETNKDYRILKTKESLIKKYGVDTMFKLINPKDSMLKKYGVDSPMKIDFFVKKLQTTLKLKQLDKLQIMFEKHDLSLLDDYKKNKNNNTSQPYTFKCKKCDNIFTSTVLGSGKIPICRKCHPLVKNSKLEELIRDYLNLNNIKHIDNNRKILNGKEIDLLIPELDIGIEINGNYYHSEIMGEKGKQYHLDKVKMANDNNIKLLQFFEDEIVLKEEIVLSRLSSVLNLNKRIFARKCTLLPISKKISKDFLNKNHLQGDTIDKYRFGLYYNDTLVSVMTFGNKRKSLGNKNNKNSEFELVRFCSILHTTVIGAFSKILNYFIINYKPSKIETYADIRWSGINHLDTVYSKNNFIFVHKTPPNYWYVKKDNYLNRYHRFLFRKNVLVAEGFSKNETEWEIMQKKGYDRIWDCGSLKFELNIY